MHGRIDIHSHLLPGIDDGCRTIDEAAECVRALIDHGYTASFCTPHIWPDVFPGNTPEHIARWTEALSDALREQGLGYALIPGGELRLFDGAVGWMRDHGVPTMGDSRCVLVDCWNRDWPDHATDTLGWLLGEGYQPILAHPERAGLGPGHEAMIEKVVDMGVLLQGNFNPFSGCDVRGSVDVVHRLMRDGRYTFLAMDMHRPDTLATRLIGLEEAVETYGRDEVDRLTADNPRRLLLPCDDTTAA